MRLKTEWDALPHMMWEKSTGPLVVANGSEVWVVLGERSIAPWTTVAAKMASTSPARLLEIVEEWKVLVRLGVMNPGSREEIRAFCQSKTDVCWEWLP